MHQKPAGHTAAPTTVIVISVGGEDWHGLELLCKAHLLSLKVLQREEYAEAVVQALDDLSQSSDEGEGKATHGHQKKRKKKTKRPEDAIIEEDASAAAGSVLTGSGDIEPRVRV